MWFKYLLNFIGFYIYRAFFFKLLSSLVFVSPYLIENHFAMIIIIAWIYKNTNDSLRGVGEIFDRFNYFFAEIVEVEGKLVSSCMLLDLLRKFAQLNLLTLELWDKSSKLGPFMVLFRWWGLLATSFAEKRLGDSYRLWSLAFSRWVSNRLLLGSWCNYLFFFFLRIGDIKLNDFVVFVKNWLDFRFSLLAALNRILKLFGAHLLLRNLEYFLCELMIKFFFP